ncbi:MAG: hypothetical protein AAFU70_07455, partial [Planctomycetota bacterium]
QPFVYVADGNYLNRGELYLAHDFSGLEIEAAKAVEVLRGLRRIWGRPVHLQCVVNEQMSLISLEDPEGEPKRESIGDETPPPAHQVA